MTDWSVIVDICFDTVISRHRYRRGSDDPRRRGFIGSLVGLLALVALALLGTASITCKVLPAAAVALDRHGEPPGIR
jgi:hypothetical protein